MNLQVLQNLLNILLEKKEEIDIFERYFSLLQKNLKIKKVITVEFFGKIVSLLLSWVNRFSIFEFDKNHIPQNNGMIF